MKQQIITLLLAGVATTTAWAVPARRNFINRTTVDGQNIQVQLVGDEFGHYYIDAQGNKYIADNADRLSPATPQFTAEISSRRNARRIEANARRIPGNVGKFPGSTFPSTGKQKAIVILVEYKDQKFEIGSDTKAHQYFSDMLNKDGFSEYGGTGSAHEYFLDSSNGKFDCQFDVFGPVTLSQNMSYYGGNDVYGNDKAPEKMVIEACKALDTQVNFKDYDRDNDGYVDNVFVIYAGQGEASGGEANTVWPHAWSIAEAGVTLKLDGVTIDAYGCSNEWENYNGTARPDGIGTFVHEFSHVLGLPDLYHTTDQVFYTPGEWSVLDYGPYNNDGRTPPAYGAFERNAMGWIDLTELSPDVGNVFLSDINYSNEAYAITNPQNSQEFYLIESRRQKGWDKYLPGTGMLIWHVDYNYSTWQENAVNNNKSHQGVDLIEADGRAEKQVRNAGDCFPGSSKVTSYSPKWWNKYSVGLDIYDITSTADGGTTFSVKANTGAGNNTGDENTGGDFLTVKDIINGEGSANTTVRGYVVGWAANWSSRNIYFTADNCNMVSNIVLADNLDERNIDNLIPVQLPAKSTVRSEVNLVDNPENLGRYIEITGKATNYFNTTGLKECTTYRFLPAPTQQSGDIQEISGQPASADDPIYDLQGRRVANTIPGHLYIQSGRKFLAR